MERSRRRKEKTKHYSIKDKLIAVGFLGLSLYLAARPSQGPFAVWLDFNNASAHMEKPDQNKADCQIRNYYPTTASSRSYLSYESNTKTEASASMSIVSVPDSNPATFYTAKGAWVKIEGEDYLVTVGHVLEVKGRMYVLSPARDRSREYSNCPNYFAGKEGIEVDSGNFAIIPIGIFDLSDLLPKFNIDAIAITKISQNPALKNMIEQEQANNRLSPLSLAPQAFASGTLLDGPAYGVIPVDKKLQKSAQYKVVQDPYQDDLTKVESVTATPLCQGMSGEALRVNDAVAGLVVQGDIFMDDKEIPKSLKGIGCSRIGYIIRTPYEKLQRFIAQTYPAQRSDAK